MSISPISNSMMSMYVPSAGISKKLDEDYEYQTIIKELALLGIPSSGDKETDRIRLDVAKRIIEMDEANSSSKKQSIPFEDIMHTLNLSVSGDLDKDYETTIDKLDYEITMAYTDEEVEYFEALKYQVETEYNFSKENSISYFSAVSQTGLMNRYILGV